MDARSDYDRLLMTPDRTGGSAMVKDSPEGQDTQGRAFLEDCRDVVLFCRDKSGSPMGYPMRTVRCHDSGLTFTTYRKSAKVPNIERDPGVGVLAADRGGPKAR